ncbi:hypothetical protein [Staphylococcus agnetis]|uniref:hypothetical protein n=1 Tax=Staphylococcus agnetis TaxID=985762 RepID=UPI0004E452F6|nr:hypothetical protein [Staphylococcus agnetis]KFE41735.1 hypothetical protein SAGN_06849 [Staphylococcus agnetis]
MNKTIKTIINVLPIFIVPLINERQKFKEHPEVKKVTDVTVNTSKTVAHKTTHAAHHVKSTAGRVSHAVVSNTGQLKENLATQKRRRDYNKAMKKEAEAQRYRRKENVRARGEELEAENRKEISKFNKKLQKHIDKRHKEETKEIEKRQKHMVKNLEKMQKYEEKAGHVPGDNDANDFELASPANEKAFQGNKDRSKVMAEGDKLEQKNKVQTRKMNKKLQKNIEKRHKEEEKQAKKDQKLRQKQLKKAQKNAPKPSEHVVDTDTLGATASTKAMTAGQDQTSAPSKKTLKQKKNDEKKRQKQAKKLEKKIQKSAQSVDLAAEAPSEDKLPPRIKSMAEVQSFEAQTGLVSKDQTPQSSAHHNTKNDAHQGPQDEKTSLNTNVEENFNHAPLFKQQYAQMEKHVKDNDQQRKDEKLNKVSDDALSKLKK